MTQIFKVVQVGQKSSYPELLLPDWAQEMAPDDLIRSSTSMRALQLVRWYKPEAYTWGQRIDTPMLAFMTYEAAQNFYRSGRGSDTSKEWSLPRDYGGRPPADWEVWECEGDVVGVVRDVIIPNRWHGLTVDKVGAFWRCQFPELAARMAPTSLGYRMDQAEYESLRWEPPPETVAVEALMLMRKIPQ